MEYQLQPVKEWMRTTAGSTVRRSMVQNVAQVADAPVRFPLSAGMVTVPKWALSMPSQVI
jgi:hypothetical protein